MILIIKCVILFSSESMVYQIEVQTKSMSEETKIVRFKPKLLQQALDQSFEKKMKVSYNMNYNTLVTA